MNRLCWPEYYQQPGYTGWCPWCGPASIAYVSSRVTASGRPVTRVRCLQCDRVFAARSKRFKVDEAELPLLGCSWQPLQLDVLDIAGNTWA